ncbi:MAG: hypothetical protein WCP34_06990 [Pseudomonadota bacterium]
MNKDDKSPFPDSSSRKFSRESTKNPSKPESLPESTPVEKGLDVVLQQQLNDKLKAAPVADENKSENKTEGLASDAPAQGQDLGMAAKSGDLKTPELTPATVAMPPEGQGAMKDAESPSPTSSPVSPTVPTTISESVKAVMASASTPKGSTAASEKERKLRAFRDAAAKMGEDGEASYARVAAVEPTTGGVTIPEVASVPSPDPSTIKTLEIPSSAPVSPTVPTTVSESVKAIMASASSPKESFLATPEKERMLKAMRDAAAKKIEDDKVSRAQLEQIPAAEKPADEKKSEAVATVVGSATGDVPTSTVVMTKEGDKAEVVTIQPTSSKKDEVVVPIMATTPAADPSTTKSETASPAPVATVLPTTISEETKEVPASAPPARESFVTAAEKERMLRSIRDAAAKEVEDKTAIRARLEQVAAAEKSVNGKKPETTTTAMESAATGEGFTPLIAMTKGGDKVEVVAVETTVTSQPAEVADVAVPVPAETAPSPSSPEEVPHPGTLMPPPLRPSAGSLRHKAEIRSATQTRINEAYLRQLKGEEPLPEEAEEPQQKPGTPQKPASPPRRASVRQRPSVGSSGQVPVESLGTGIYNILGDMVGGVVTLARALGGGVKQAVAPDPTSQASGTTQMADKMVRGVRGVFSGAGEIVKGGGNIVVGTIGVVTMPVVEAVGAVIHSVKSPSRPEESVKESTASSRTSQSDS